MKAEQLSVGVKIQLSNGATAEVVGLIEGQPTARVKFLDSPFDEEQVGKEEIVSVDEITSFYSGEDLTQTEGQLA